MKDFNFFSFGAQRGAYYFYNFSFGVIETLLGNTNPLNQELTTVIVVIKTGTQRGFNVFWGFITIRPSKQIENFLEFTGVIIIRHYFPKLGSLIQFLFLTLAPNAVLTIFIIILLVL